VSDVDEAEAIRRCQHGETAAFTGLVARYEREALRLAYLLTGDRFLAEDIAQESFLRAYQAIRRFDTSKPFRPWLLRIVTNQARMTHRTARRQPAVSLNALLEDGGDASPMRPQATLQLVSPDPDVRITALDEQAALAQALATLTRKQREAVALRYYLDLSDSEIAQVMQCRPDTARHRIYDGLRALERIIRRQHPWLLEDYTHVAGSAHSATLTPPTPPTQQPPDTEEVYRGIQAV